ncbi:hypothetical protein GCM10019016_138720 [Streptomyces prasinosporus]|uniref:TetR family transcriptional regulator n=1 Tax=Streptomyces prasinosporus TaxID=68256 RepID=A0ABP6UJB8_9ACTN
MVRTGSPGAAAGPTLAVVAAAPHLLLRMMDGHQPESTRTELSTRLVERASTAPPGPRPGARGRPGTPRSGTA